MNNITGVTKRVTVLSYTSDFDRNIARGAKLCYSPSSIKDISDKMSDEDVKKFLTKLLNLGHGSVLEHSSITFGIEGISRAAANQLVRHRIASYSQKSQRYVEESDFDYIVPEAIKNDPAAMEVFEVAMKEASKHYKTLTGILHNQYIVDSDTNKSVGDLKKKAIEDARAVLPNACETKIVVTMNARALYNFFRERLCDRAQTEIRGIAHEMWEECMAISPTVFKHAVPSCVYGKCKEGVMTCGKADFYKEKYETGEENGRHTDL